MGTYEKEYKNIMSRLQAFIDVQPDVTKKALVELFPELAESEDEKIRKEIINFIATTPKAKQKHHSWIAWLEKQGKQKPVECDDSIVEETISLINKLASGYGENVDEPITFNGVKMINNIKERLRAIQPQSQPNSEWSEKDEAKLSAICSDIMSYSPDCFKDNSRKVDWLKSLKGRCQPQPKEEPVSVRLKAEINYWNQRGLSIRIEDKCLEDFGFKEGDKVKVTIIKET